MSGESEMNEETKKVTHGFQTEVKQLLQLMINSLYGNREIFLRELISNASDAADKLRFEALSNEALYEGDGELEIRVAFDKDSRTISVSDNGVGMGYDEIVEDLGTIAKSGTRHFFDALTGDQASDAQLIGQFGVGFYSCFIVSDRVTVVSRRAGVPPAGGVRWESIGEGEFTVERLEVARRGTEITLHLREGEDEFLEGFRLRSIVRKYSDHISLPIRMAGEGEATEDETVNAATALWSRAKHEISQDEYDEFYKHVAHDFEAPLAHLHSRVEGNLEYSSLLFIPARAPFDLWDRNVRRGVKLYVRRVFIMDDAEQLMPPFLRFVRGVIDSADLPLNISREILQKNKQIDSIRSGSVKRVLDLLANIATNEADKYATFWREFGRVLKEGLIDDPKNHESVAKLLRFFSSKDESDEPKTSLDDYVGRMKAGQDHIYYITADNLVTARNSPHLEVFRDKGVEVLLLVDEIDEWVVHHLDAHDGKSLLSVSKGELDLSGIAGDGDEESQPAEDPGEHEALIEKLASRLDSRVKAVRITHRLTTSPACLVVEEGEMGPHLERLLKAAGQSVSATRPILEVNPRHPIIERFRTERDGQRCDDWAQILFDQAILAEGGRLEDGPGFVRRLNDLLVAIAAARKPAVKRKPTTRKKAPSRSTRGKRGSAKSTSAKSDTPTEPSS